MAIKRRGVKITSNLVHSVTNIIFGTAVAGFGFGIGRDTWKWVKNNGIGGVLFLAVAVCSLLGCFFGARGLIRGHDRGIIGTIFKTILLNLVLMCVSILSAFFIVLLIAAMFTTNDISEGWSDHASTLIPIAGFELLMIITGLFAGFFQRKKRLTAFRIERENDVFLKQVGIRETGGKDITHIDVDNNNLRLIENLNDRLVFMVVGRRGRRAYITFDDMGRMMDYSGVKI